MLQQQQTQTNAIRKVEGKVKVLRKVCRGRYAEFPKKCTVPRQHAYALAAAVMLLHIPSAALRITRLSINKQWQERPK